MRRKALGIVATVGLGASLLVGGTPAQANVTCAAPDHAGGEWRTYGGTLDNSRRQDAESTIGATNVSTLGPRWVFDTSKHVPTTSSGGAFSNTPTIADGCAYLATNTGWVFAVNADTGERLWRTLLGGRGQTLLGGVIVGSPTVANGIVYVGVSQPGAPYVAALDQNTGHVLWRATVETGQPNALINASPVYVDGMIFQGFAGNEGNTDVSRGGYALVDAGRECDTGATIECPNPVAGATGGQILAHRHTISDEEYAEGYRGASVWCTAAIDPVEKYAYACGGNPHSEALEATYANSLLKIDIDKNRETFGDIVAAYKGNADQYHDGLDDQPVCENFSDETTVLVWSAGCLMLDLDFGSSPNLMRDPEGRTIIGGLQKSGVYHAAHADDMTPAWSSIVGAPCLACNATSPAFDKDRVYVVGTPVSQLFGLSRAGVGPVHQGWVTPIGDGIHYESVSTANGLVYVVDNTGALNVYESTTGVQLLKRPLAVDNGGKAAADVGSQGVSIARNTVYAASGSFVVAYQPQELG